MNILEEKALIHDIKSRLVLGQPLTRLQRNYYLMFMANPEQISEYIKKEKEGKKV